MFECTQLPGDLLFTPSGWWHQVKNTKPSLSLTENLVNESNADIVYGNSLVVDDSVLASVRQALIRSIELGRGRDRRSGIRMTKPREN